MLCDAPAHRSMHELLDLSWEHLDDLTQGRPRQQPGLNRREVEMWIAAGSTFVEENSRSGGCWSFGGSSVL